MNWNCLKCFTVYVCHKQKADKLKKQKKKEREYVGKNKD